MSQTCKARPFLHEPPYDLLKSFRYFVAHVIILWFAMKCLYNKSLGTQCLAQPAFYDSCFRFCVPSFYASHRKQLFTAICFKRLNLNCPFTYKDLNKWPTFCKWHWQVHFFADNACDIMQKSPKYFPKIQIENMSSIWQYVILSEAENLEFRTNYSRRHVVSVQVTGYVN